MKSFVKVKLVCLFQQKKLYANFELMVGILVGFSVKIVVRNFRQFSLAQALQYVAQTSIVQQYGSLTAC